MNKNYFKIFFLIIIGILSLSLLFFHNSFAESGMIISDSGGAPGGDVGGAPGGDVGGGPGRETNFTFEIPNPIAAESFTDLINAIGKFIFNISIPIAVILIIVSGLKFLFSQGKPGKVAEAKKMLAYTLIGLTIIFIGKGFVTLIKSILDLGR